MRFRLAVAALVLLQAVLVHAFVAQRFPLSGDDHSYLYQARLFAAGRLYAEDALYDHRHPLHGCIETNCLRDENGRRFSKYAPGWPAILAVGVRLQAPWLVQPLLAAGLTLLILGYLERRIGRRSVKTAALLLTLCLFYAYYGASYRPHLTTALCIFAAFLAAERSREGPGQGTEWIAVAGLLLGASALIRYTDWIPLGAWIGFGLLRSGRVRAALVFAACVSLVASGNLAWGWVLSGQPLVAPTHLGGDAGLHDRLTVSWQSLSMTASRLALVAGVFPPAILLFRDWKRVRAGEPERTWVILFLANAGIYGLFTAAVGGPGPRYLFSYFPFLVIAVVAWHERFVRAGAPGAGRWWRAVLVAQMVGSAVFIARETYTLYWRRDVARTMAVADADGPASRRIVLLTTGTYRTDARDLTMNPPDLEAAETLYLSNCAPREVESLEARFAGRRFLAYRFPGSLAEP